MFGYLLFPIGAFVIFNHPKFYEYAVRQTMETMSQDVNIVSLEQYQRRSAEADLNKFNNMLDEIDGKKKNA